MTDDNASHDAVVIERSFDAPADLIWRMWTEPEHFKAWYGPDGATVPVAKMDVRVGGTRLVCMQMQTPDGPIRMWFTGVYREVVGKVRLVFTDSMSDENGNVLSPADLGMPQGHPATTEVTVELEDIGGCTTMVMTHAGVPAGSPGAAGWAMALTNLPPTSKHTAGDRTADRVENEWHRNTVELDSSIDKTELEWMIDHSYELVDARYTASGPSPFPRCSIGGSASINRPVRRPGARSERPCADVGDRTFDLVR